MVEEEKTLTPEASSASKTKTEESSTSEPQAEEATSQKAVEEKEPPFHEHPRWKEQQERLREAEEKASQYKSQAEYYRGVSEAAKTNTVKEIDQEIVDASTPEEKKFWENVKKVSRAEAEAVRKEERENYNRELQGYQKMVGNVIANDFLKNHPDIKKGTPEAKAISEKAWKLHSMGMDLTEALEDSYKTAMFDVNAKAAVERDRQKQKEDIKRKETANVETKAMPKTSPIAQGKFAEFDAIFNKQLDESGLSF